LEFARQRLAFGRVFADVDGGAKGSRAGKGRGGIEARRMSPSAQTSRPVHANASGLVQQPLRGALAAGGATEDHGLGRQ
jgi:hypothetical protein